MKMKECSEVAVYLLFREDRQEEFSMRLCDKHLKPEVDGLFKEEPGKEYSLAALNHSAGLACDYQEMVMTEGKARDKASSQKPPEWFRTEAVEVTCVGATDHPTGNMYVFMLWRAAAGFDNQQDMFTLTFFDNERVLMNGAMLDASDRDIELLSRMTDATILGPYGPSIGVTVTVRASDIPEYDLGHNCPREAFLDDPITKSSGMGSEMLHLIPCEVCDARDKD